LQSQVLTDVTCDWVNLDAWGDRMCKAEI